MKIFARVFPLVTVVACASSSSPEPRGGAAPSAAHAVTPAGLMGTWTFSLDASDVASPMRARCASESAGDAARAESCFATVCTEASKEKVRWTRASGGATTWTSFVADDDREEVVLEVPIELVEQRPREFVMRPTGVARGKEAAVLREGLLEAIVIDVIDDRTIAMNDPKKGRLVFSRD